MTTQQARSDFMAKRPASPVGAEGHAEKRHREEEPPIFIEYREHVYVRALRTKFPGCSMEPNWLPDSTDLYANPDYANVYLAVKFCTSTADKSRRAAATVWPFMVLGDQVTMNRGCLQWQSITVYSSADQDKWENTQWYRIHALAAKLSDAAFLPTPQEGWNTDRIDMILLKPSITRDARFVKEATVLRIRINSRNHETLKRQTMIRLTGDSAMLQLPTDSKPRTVRWTDVKTCATPTLKLPRYYETSRAKHQPVSPAPSLLEKLTTKAGEHALHPTVRQLQANKLVVVLDVLLPYVKHITFFNGGVSYFVIKTSRKVPILTMPVVSARLKSPEGYVRRITSLHALTEFVSQTSNRPVTVLQMADNFPPADMTPNPHASDAIDAMRDKDWTTTFRPRPSRIMLKVPESAFPAALVSHRRVDVNLRPGSHRWKPRTIDCNPGTWHREYGMCPGILPNDHLVRVETLPDPENPDPAWFEKTRIITLTRHAFFNRRHCGMRVPGHIRRELRPTYEPDALVVVHRILTVIMQALNLEPSIAWMIMQFCSPSDFMPSSSALQNQRDADEAFWLLADVKDRIAELSAADPVRAEALSKMLSRHIVHNSSIKGIRQRVVLLRSFVSVKLCPMPYDEDRWPIHRLRAVCNRIDRDCLG